MIANRRRKPAACEHRQSRRASRAAVALAEYMRAKQGGLELGEWTERESSHLEQVGAAEGERQHVYFRVQCALVVCAFARKEVAAVYPSLQRTYVHPDTCARADGHARQCDRIGRNAESQP